MSTHDMLRDCVDDPNITTILNLLKSVHRRLGELEKHYDQSSRRLIAINRLELTLEKIKTLDITHAALRVVNTACDKIDEFISKEENQ